MRMYNLRLTPFDHDNVPSTRALEWLCKLADRRRECLLFERANHLPSGEPARGEREGRHGQVRACARKCAEVRRKSKCSAQELTSRGYRRLLRRSTTRAMGQGTGEMLAPGGGGGSDDAWRRASASRGVPRSTPSPARQTWAPGLSFLRQGSSVSARRTHRGSCPPSRSGCGEL